MNSLNFKNEFNFKHNISDKKYHLENSILKTMLFKNIDFIKTLLKENNVYTHNNNENNFLMEKIDEIFEMDSKRIIQFFSILLSLPLTSEISINDIVMHREYNIKNRFNFKKIRSYGNINSLIKYRISNEVNKLYTIRNKLNMINSKIYFPISNSYLMKKETIFYYGKYEDNKIVFIHNLSDKNIKLSLSEIYETGIFKELISGQIYADFSFVIEGYGSLWLHSHRKNI